MSTPQYPGQSIPPEGSLTGTSPIGTSSPNSSSSANTNSTYAPGAYTSGVTPQTSATSYTFQDTDYQGVVLFNTSSAIAVTLNSNVKQNFVASVFNVSTGIITLTTSDGSSINGSGNSLALASGAGASVFFADREWTVFSQATIIPVVPETIAAVTGEYLTGYNATTGVFTRNGTAGISATITTAKLTSGGTEGSMVFVAGLLTAQTPAT